MKSAHEIAQQILDDWPYAGGIRSAHKTLLVAMIAEKLSEGFAKSREDTLEEAAKGCESDDAGFCDRFDCADLIRALKEKKP